MEQSAGTESSTDNTLGSINIGMPLPVTSGIDPSVNTPSSGTVSGSISVPSVGDATSQQAIAAQPHHIQLPGAAMSIGSIAMAMGLSGANTDPNSLSFTSNALATLTARMGMSSVAGSNSAGLVTPGNSLVTFPTNTALNLVPGVSMNLPGAAGAGVSIVDGGGLSMAVAGGMAMHTPGNVNVVGVAASNDLNSSNIAAGGQPQTQQQGQHNGGAILHNNIHLNAGGSNLNMVNNLSGPSGSTSVVGGAGQRGSSSAPVSSSSNVLTSHPPGSCCGGCKTRVTVKDQYCQTDLSTVLQVKTEERLARSGLMPGARLISSIGQGTTVSHANPNSHHGPNMPCSCDFCGRMFAKKEYLRRHVRIHTGERPYKCVICGHSFRRSHHLRCHELTHTGTKPYTCGICGKAFNLSHHLRRHEMTHTGEKPYACSECGKAFTRKQHLDRHYKTHTGEYHRTFKCPFCEKMFYRAHHRDKHMKRHVLTTPDLTVATFSPVSNMNLSIRPDGTLRADGLNSSPISVGSKDESHSSEDYLTSDEDGNKIPNTHKPPKEGSKKRKGSSPMRLRFPYDYNSKDGADGMKLSNIEMNQMKNMGFNIPHGTAGPSHIPSSLSQSGTTILSTPTRGRPKGSKNKISRAGKKNNKAETRPPLLNPNQLIGMEMKTERMDIDRDAYGGVVKKDEESLGTSNSGGMYGGKAIPNIPQQFVSESVVVRHPLQGVGSPHNLNQPQPAGAHSDKNKTDGSTPGPVPTPTQTPTPDGRGGGGGPMQWPNAQQVGMTQSGNNGTDYMPGLTRQLHTPGPAPGVNPSSNGASEAQQTCHYKPPSTPDQNIHHSWSSASAWPRLSATSDMAGPNAYGQMDASRFMNLYNASKVMEMRMSDLRAPHGLDGSQWNQGRRDPSQEKGADNRIYNMHQ